MTRESVLGFVNRQVRIAHGGPIYVRLADPHGMVVSVSDTQLLLEDPCATGDAPRAWSLDTIAEVIALAASDAMPLP